MINYNDAKYNLIITVVNRGFADQVVEASRKAGAKGGTIVYARGTGVHEMEKFMNITIQPEKELVLTVVQRKDVKEVTSSIIEAAGLNTESRGLSITLPITDVVGLDSSEKKEGVIEVFEDEGSDS